MSAGVLLAQASGVTSQAVAHGTGEVPEALEIPAASTDILTNRITLAPDGIVPWHYHPGPTTATVLKGTLTIEDCMGQRNFAAGAAFIAPPGHVHQDRNLTAEEAEVLVTYIIPVCRDTRDFVDPPTC